MALSQEQLDRIITAAHSAARAAKAPAEEMQAAIDFVTEQTQSQENGGAAVTAHRPAKTLPGIQATAALLANGNRVVRFNGVTQNNGNRLYGFTL